MSEPSWGEFEAARPPAAPPDDDTAKLAARLFNSVDGDAFLDHLRGFTKNRVLPPTASDQALRHLEGQRALVGYIEAMIARGNRAMAAAAKK